METTMVPFFALSLGRRQQGAPTSRSLYDLDGSAMTLLGMTLIELPLEGEQRSKLGSSRGLGVLVADRSREAYRGGIRNGDLIVEVNSVKIRSIADLRRVLKKHDPHTPLCVFLLNAAGWRFTNLSFISCLPE